MAATFQSARGRRTRRSINDINMVPFIDVMLVLLIIFMVTAPLLTPSVIDVPSVGKAANVPEQVITIEIDKQLHIQVKSKSTGNSTASQIKQDATWTRWPKLPCNCKQAKRKHRSSSQPTNPLPMKTWSR